MSDQPSSAAVLPSLFSFQQVKMIFGLAAALSIGIGITLWSIRPNYTPLFNQLSDRDALQVTEVLQSESIPFEIDKITGLVLVPQDQLKEARMKLSASGAPFSSASGFEMLREEQSLGTSQFMETTRYHHVLETELARTISAMRNIESARVHLALPKQSVFVRQRSKSSASVMLKLYAGRMLDDSQVDSIVHLVASSVPYMEVGDVAVVDQWGRMLSSQTADPNMAATRQHLAYVRKLERDYVNRIEALLTPIVGFGRIKAEVNVEADFTDSESFQELYDPNSNVVRSEQIQENQSSGGQQAAGIPGALTNQPPVAGNLDPAAAEAGDNAVPTNSSRRSIRNFEMDKTIRRTRQGQGQIQRLNIAVVIDDKVTVNEEGEETRIQYTQAELDRFSELIKTAVGFQEARGDSVEVINSAFQIPEELEPVPDIPIWQQAWLWNIVRQVLAGLVVLFIVFGMVRPALRSLGNKPETIDVTPSDEDDEEEDAETENDETLTLSHQGAAAMLPSPPHVYSDILNMAKAMAAEDPKRVAKVIKDWVAEEE